MLKDINLVLLETENRLLYAKLECDMEDEEEPEGDEPEGEEPEGDEEEPEEEEPEEEE